jgi:hypothetical protein
MDQTTKLRITLTPDDAGALRNPKIAALSLAAPLARLSPDVRRELADLEPAVLKFLRANPKNVEALAKDPVGTLRDHVNLSPNAVAAIAALRAQSEKQYPGIPGTKIDRISVAVAKAS